jgi:hypothetical protein
MKLAITSIIIHYLDWQAARGSWAIVRELRKRRPIYLVGKGCYRQEPLRRPARRFPSELPASVVAHISGSLQVKLTAPLGGPGTIAAGMGAAATACDAKTPAAQPRPHR